MSQHHRKFHTRKSPRHPTFDYTNAGAYFITINTKNRRQYFGNIRNGKMRLNDLGEQTRRCRKQIPDHYPFVNVDEFVCMPDHIHGIIIIGNHQWNRDLRTQYLNTSWSNKWNRDVRTQYLASSWSNKWNRDVRTQYFASSWPINQHANQKPIVRTDNNPSLPKTIKQTPDVRTQYFASSWPINQHANQKPIVRTDNNPPLPKTIKQTPDVRPQYLASSWPINQHPNQKPIVRTDNNPSLPKTIGPKSGSLWSIVRGFKIGVTKYANHHNKKFSRQPRYHDRIIRDQEAYNQIRRYIINNPRNRKKK